MGTDAGTGVGTDARTDAGIAEAGATGDEAAFLVRSYVPAQERWIQYSLERDDPRLVRWEGSPPENGAAVVTTADDQDGRHGGTHRMSWTREGDTLIRRTETSRDGGQAWTTTARATLRKVGGQG